MLRLTVDKKLEDWIGAAQSEKVNLHRESPVAQLAEAPSRLNQSGSSAVARLRSRFGADDWRRRSHTTSAMFLFTAGFATSCLAQSPSTTASISRTCWSREMFSPVRITQIGSSSSAA